MGLLFKKTAIIVVRPEYFLPFYTIKQLKLPYFSRVATVTKKMRSKLLDIILEKIRDDGPVSFRDFMELSLYHPEYGYYSRELILIGSGGDFMTAPQATPLFGALLSVQIKQLFNIIKKIPYNLVEIGPGTGALARGILDYLPELLNESDIELKKQINYQMVEPSVKRRRPLSILFENYGLNVQVFHEVPDKLGHGVIIANEVLDAFPVHLIEKKDDQFFQIYIDYNENENSLTEMMVPLMESQNGEVLYEYCIKNLSGIEGHYRTEINLEMREWISQMEASIDTGFLLVIDYGHSRNEYFHPARNRGTIMGYEKHRLREDILSSPGEIDITAHVNFSDLSSWGKQAGFDLIGYAPQWAFLGGLDFQDTVNMVMGNPDPFSPALAQIKSLIFPQTMGQSHKVMLFSKGIELSGFVPKGFLLKNDIDRL